MNRRNLFRVALGAVATALPIKAAASTPDSLKSITLERGEAALFMDRDAGWALKSIEMIPATPAEEIAYFSGDPGSVEIENDLNDDDTVKRWRVRYDGGEWSVWQLPEAGAGEWSGG